VYSARTVFLQEILEVSILLLMKKAIAALKQIDLLLVNDCYLEVDFSLAGCDPKYLP